LQSGKTLSDVTADIAQLFGVDAAIAPMTDHQVHTVVETPEGPIAFQHYFVRERCEPKVTGFRFEGAADAVPSPAVAKAFRGNGPELVVICPSNPFISIDPILAVPGMRDMLENSAAPVIAVSPIVGGKAIKGPTGKMMDELGMDASAEGVARHYKGLIDGFVLDSVDANAAAAIKRLGCDVLVTNTVMKSLDDRVVLARKIIAFSNQLKQN